jgi:hypothetical protein
MPTKTGGISVVKSTSIGTTYGRSGGGYYDCITHVIYLLGRWLFCVCFDRSLAWENNARKAAFYVLDERQATAASLLNCMPNNAHRICPDDPTERQLNGPKRTSMPH